MGLRTEHEADDLIMTDGRIGLGLCEALVLVRRNDWIYVARLDDMYDIFCIIMLPNAAVCKSGTDHEHEQQT